MAKSIDIGEDSLFYSISLMIFYDYSITSLDKYNKI